FEPSIRDKPYTPLAGERLQPLGHLTVLRSLILLSGKNKSNTLLRKSAFPSLAEHLITKPLSKASRVVTSS
ncbi:hypothetical protein P0Y67_09875, partial [Photobacterium sp. SP02]|uniref:hypothetical protein n=1 Tax=Photobacterium sp. SP02 TaxID=3032280 RepID=UPI0031455C11